VAKANAPEDASTVPVTARAGDRRFGPLSALCARTHAPHRPDLLWETLAIPRHKSICTENCIDFRPHRYKSICDVNREGRFAAAGRARIGFARIVGSETEAPVLLANLVWSGHGASRPADFPLLTPNPYLSLRFTMGGAG
jgi:hypothetical protein